MFPENFFLTKRFKIYTQWNISKSLIFFPGTLRFNDGEEEEIDQTFDRDQYQIRFRSSIVKGVKQKKLKNILHFSVSHLSLNTSRDIIPQTTKNVRE